MRYLKKFIEICLVLSILVITFSSLVYLYDVRDKISKTLKARLSFNKLDKEKNLKKLTDKKYAEAILEGNYILFFRHAHRQKWLDVPAYDAEEALQGLQGENTFFKDAVCLSNQGQSQSKIMGKQFARFNLPIGKVISSPSCRSRQTAINAFGKIDDINIVFLHTGPFNESVSDHVKLVRQEMLDISVDQNTNIIISSHGNVIEKEVFDEIKLIDYFDSEKNKNYNLDLGEGGFMVISKKDQKIILEHIFVNYKEFAKPLHNRKVN
tara:strand:+ start:797 stop:1594 length:798 start_codon:yes stop_codon:yes gene_type:complete